ncbi:chalcone isomerase family protein [Hydrogenophaga sp. RWCD_12]|uniref:chalcone isomerase family protein n=1 Tax=Hydrogenophaga sp. RWCD_12 TaxID=3391190 RepID=UPI003984D55C
MVNQQPFRRAVLALVLAATPWMAWAAFPSTARLADTDLVLNGQGVRYRVVFKVYEMALYTAKPVSTVEQLLALPGPKRLSFVALRELPGTDLGLAFLKGLSSNTPKDQVQKHVVSTNRLIEIFSGKPKLMPGDTFAMEFVPGKGTQFFIQDQPQGAPVGDAEFFNMVLRIWVGPSPADNQLRDHLLGKAD